MPDRIIPASQLGLPDIGTSVLVQLAGEDAYIAGPLNGIRYEREPNVRLASGAVHSWESELALKVGDIWVEVRHATQIRVSERNTP